MTLTLVCGGPEDGRELDVTISAPPGCLLGGVAEQLRAAAGKPGAVLYAGSTRLADDAPLGAPGLRHGSLLGVGSPGPRRGAASAVLELRVVSGLSAGLTHGLSRGEHIIGRGSSCAVHLDDPVCSRRHAVVTVGTDGVTVADLGSTNGLLLDGATVRTEPVPIMPGQLLRIGDSVLSLAVPADVPAVTRPTRDGTVAVNRPPRLAEAPTEVTIDWPTPPGLPATPRLAVIAVVLPVIAGVVLAVLFRMPQFLLFTLLSPLMMLGNYLSDRTGRRRGRRRAMADHEHAVRCAEADRDRAVALDSAARRRAVFDLAAVTTSALRPGQRLWERRPGDRDFLLVRVGTATWPGGVSLRRDGRSEPVQAPDLPVTVPLDAVGVLGLAGPDEPLLAIARGLLCQLATLHSPRDLRIVLLTTADLAARWAWARWLPQLRRVDSAAQLTALLDERQRERRTGPPDTVLVVHESGRLRAAPGVARLLAEGPAAGILALCLDRHERRLPAECRAVAAICGDVGSRLRLSLPPQGAAADVLADGLPLSVAAVIARALAPLRDPGDGAEPRLPGQVRLLDLLGLPEPSGESLAAAWAATDLTPRALLGGAARGPYGVDLVRDGPHLLVAGTTGSGKSELLQTLIAALAATMPPTAVQFVLVDYKGGAAFRDCARLPHTVGLVTDLDTHLTQRALRSLAAELTRRERTLAAAGASDLAGYLGSEPLPRLVIIVDEFAALAQELPDFVRGLVAVAARGRSLGIHLVLATQRPGGAVTPEIRANTSLRIALRVTDEAESRDIVEQPGAARISKHTPGRALIRSGTEPATLVQTARVAGRAPPPAPGPTVAVGWPTRSGPPADDGDGPTDLQRIVDAAQEAARLTGWQPLPSPWLPPLPDLLRLDELSDGPVGAAVLGLIDHPDEQRRSPLTFDLATDASLLIAGGQRSGRTTAVRTLLASLTRTWSADDVHVHVIDCAGGGLLAAERLPHCGCAIGRDDTARGRRLLARLVEETGRRQVLLARTGAASLAEHVGPKASRPPYVVLVLDGWEGFVQSYEPVDAGQPVEALLRLIREGAAAGIRVVVTSDRGGLGVRLSGLIARRVVLPLADRSDYALAGIPARAVPAHLPPGRGLLPDTALECQLAVVSEDPSGAAQTAALDAIAATTRGPERHPPLRIAELPATVALDRLPAPDRPMWTVLGRGGDEAEPIMLDLDALGSGLLVAGPARSGKSTALLVLAHGLLHTGTPVVAVTGRRSVLRSLAGVRALLGPADDEALRAATADPPAVVLADDIESLVDAPVDRILAELVRDDRGVTVIGAGRSDDLAGQFRGLGVDLRRRRTGLLLTPGPLDGELLGVRIPRGLTDHLPGRGYLVEHGSLTRVQVARPAADG